MGPVAGGPGIPGCPLQLVATCNGAAGGVIVPRVAMAPGWLAWQGGGRVAWQEGVQLQWGGDCSTWSICGTAGRGPQHDDMDCAVRGGRAREAGGCCLL